jgi:hypothetical protein
VGGPRSEIAAIAKQMVATIVVTRERPSIHDGRPSSCGRNATSAMYASRPTPPKKTEMPKAIRNSTGSRPK